MLLTTTIMSKLTLVYVRTSVMNYVCEYCAYTAGALKNSTSTVFFIVSIKQHTYICG